MENEFNLPKAVSECIESEYSISSELIDGIQTVADAFTFGATTAIVKVCNAFKSHTYKNFVRNLLTFLKSLEGTTVEQRCGVLAQMEEIGDDEAGIILTNIIDKLDHVKKSEIVANLFKASIDSKIDTEMFMRLSSVLIRIPYVDLKHVKDFQEDNYIPCVAEVLYSAGVICLCEIGGDIASNGQDKYHITPIGYNLLRYGMNMDLEKVEGSSIKIQIQSEQFREEDFPLNGIEKLSEDEEMILKNWCESKKVRTRVHYFAQGIDFSGGIRNNSSYFTEVEWVRKWKPFFDKCIALEYVDQTKENEYTLTNKAFEYFEKMN